MKKYQVFILTVVLTPLLAGLYGIVHNQFTYTISHEYFTKFKFQQFELTDTGTPVSNPRILAAAVGFLATWWTGLIIGIFQAMMGLTQKTGEQMWIAVKKGIMLTLITTAITGLIGLAYGYFYLVNTPVSWWLPENLIDKKHFIVVGSMHNFSYLGGLLGLMTSIVYQTIFRIKDRRKMRAQHP